MPSGGVRPGAGRPKKDGGSKKTPEFTSEQLQTLLNSPYIAAVSRNSVSYTLAFKEHFWKRYCDGVQPVQIFEEAGLSVEILGRARVNTLAKTLRGQKERGLQFNEGDKPHIEKPEKQFEFPIPPRKRTDVSPVSALELSKLVHQVEFLSQELEFIKKIILAEKGKKSK